MDINEAVNNPKINVFDICISPKGKRYVFTYPKPGESIEEFNKRHEKNITLQNG